MNTSFAKTKKMQLMVLLMVVAVVALVAAVALSAVISANADVEYVPFNGDQYELANQLASTPSDKAIRLTADVELDSSLVISRSTPVILDLHGYALHYRGTAAAPVITVNSGSLTIVDTANASAPAHTVGFRGQNVQIKGGLIYGGKDGGVLVNGGSFNFEGGTIAGNSSSLMDVGGGVTFKANAADFHMKGTATISYNSASQGGGVYFLARGGRLVMDGGKIENNYAAVNGGGVYLTGSQGIALEFKRGSISNNTAENGKGGGVFVGEELTVNVTGKTVSTADYDEDAAKISGNKAVNGGGVYLEKATLKLEGGTISANTSSSDGAGIYANNSTVTTTSSSYSTEILNNKASYGNGAGVYLLASKFDFWAGSMRGNQITNVGNGAGVYLNDAGSRFRTTIAVITGNSVNGSGEGGGVYFGAGEIYMAIAPQIYGNTAAGTANNLRLVGSQTFLNFTGVVNSAANVHVTVDSARIFTRNYTSVGNKTVQGFTSDTANWSTVLVDYSYEIEKANPELTGDPTKDKDKPETVVETVTTQELAFRPRSVVSVLNHRTNVTTPYGTIEQAFDAVNTYPTIAFTITLLADVETTSTLIVSTGNLTLDLNGYMIRNTTTTANVIEITPTAQVQTINFTVRDSRPEAGPHEVAVAEAIYLYNPAVTTPTVKIYGGVITGGFNGIRYSGQSSATVNFVFESGTVAGVSGVGVVFNGAIGNGTMTLRSGAASRYNSNGVGVDYDAHCIIEGGDLSYNSTNGVSIPGTVGSALTMYDGRITYNGQAGISARTTAPIDIRGGDISYNGFSTYEYAPEVDSAIYHVTHAGIELHFNDAAVGNRNFNLLVSGGTISHNAWEGIVINNGQATDTNDDGSTRYVVNVTGGEISYNGREGIRLTNSWARPNKAADQTVSNASIANANISYNGWNGIYSKATLVVKDTKLEHNGQTGANYYYNAAIRGVSATIDLNNVTIYGDGQVSSRDAISLEQATLTMTGGSISNAYEGVRIFRSTFTLDGGVIENSSRGVLIYGGGTFNMLSGRLSGNITGLDFYSVDANQKGLANLEGGEISGNIIGVVLASASSTGEGKIIMKDGFTIHDNYNDGSFGDSYGGGVLIGQSMYDGPTRHGAGKVIFEMQGGSIYNNSAMYGGGVAVHPSTSGTLDAQFIMTGGTIENNKAVHGGGVYYGSGATTIQMSGKPYVLGNTDMSGNVASNLYITGEQKIEITGVIDWARTDLDKPETHKVGLTVESIYTDKVLTNEYSTDGHRNNEIKGFVLDTAPEGVRLGTSNNEIVIIMDGGSGMLAVGKWNSATKTFTPSGEKYGTWKEAYNAVVGEGTEGAIQLLADVGVTETIEITKNLTLDLNGYMIQSGTGTQLTPLIDLPATSTNVTFTIEDSTYVNHVTTSTIGHWFMDPTTSKWVTLYGGVIHGQLRVYAGTVNFNAGNVVNGISAFNNVAHVAASYGVRVLGGELFINEGAAICYNTDAGLHHDGGHTTIAGGKLYGNISVYGGAILGQAPGILMTSGEIFGNVTARASADPSGAAVSLCQGSSWGEMTMTGGSIYDNVTRVTSSNSAGIWGTLEVYSSAGGYTKFTMTGGSIINNRVEAPSDWPYLVYSSAGVGVSSTGTTALQSEVTLGGTAVIANNTVNDVEKNIQLNRGVSINIASGGFKTGAHIGVSLPVAGDNYVFTKGYMAAGNDGDWIPFFADDATNCLMYIGLDNRDEQFAESKGELILNAHSTSNPLFKHFNDMEIANCKDKPLAKPERWHCEVCDRYYISVDPFVEYDEARDDIRAEHQFTDYQFQNNNYHRAVCTVCGETINNLEHVTTDWMASSNGQHVSTCSVCREQVKQDCTYQGAENMKRNETAHWQQCSTCGQRFDEAPHAAAAGAKFTFVNASTHQSTCADCGYVVTASHRSQGVAWTFEKDEEGKATGTGDSEHYQICPDCDGIINRRDHELEIEEKLEMGGSYTESRCVTCGYFSTTAHHKANAEMQKNANGHWYDCELHAGEVLNYEAHDASNLKYDVSTKGRHRVYCEVCNWEDTADCSFTGFTSVGANGHSSACSVCGQLFEGEGGSTVIPHAEVLRRTGEQHWYECTECHAVTQEAVEHTWTAAFDEAQHYEYCPVCFEEDGTRVMKEGSVVTHDFSGAWITNENEHWTKCTGCEALSAKVAHSKQLVSDGVDGHHYECTACDWAEESSTAHKWEARLRTTTTGHYHRCEECFYSETEKPHTYEENSYVFIGGGQHSRDCTECGKSQISECVNTFNVTDTAHTSHCTLCGNDGVATPHALTYTSNASYHWQRCETCGYSNYETAKVEHDFNNAEGVCPTCKRSSDDKLASDRFNANNELAEAAAAAKAQLKSEGKSVYEGLIDRILANATADIESASEIDEINAAVKQAIADFNSNVLRDRREYANAQLSAKEAELMEALGEDVSAENKAKYADAIAAAKAAAIAAVENGANLSAVESELKAGVAAMEKAKLDTTKKIVQDAIDQEAQAKKDEIESNPDLSEEEKKELGDIIDREADRAKGEVENADSEDDVKDAEQRGNDVMDDIVTNPDLAGDKSDARDDLDKDAQAKKDEIQKKADEEMEKVDQDPDLSDLQKAAKKEEIQKEADEQKKKVDEENKKAQDNVTDATTPEEVKGAVDKGKEDMGEAAKPKPDEPGTDKPVDPVDPDPVKGNWFEENALPVGIAAAIIGVLLLLIIILAIASRKRKSK